MEYSKGESAEKKDPLELVIIIKTPSVFVEEKIALVKELANKDFVEKYAITKSTVHCIGLSYENDAVRCADLAYCKDEISITLCTTPSCSPLEVDGNSHKHSKYYRNDITINAMINDIKMAFAKRNDWRRKWVINEIYYHINTINTLKVEYREFKPYVQHVLFKLSAENKDKAYRSACNLCKEMRDVNITIAQLYVGIDSIYAPTEGDNTIGVIFKLHSIPSRALRTGLAPTRKDPSAFDPNIASRLYSESYESSFYIDDKGNVFDYLEDDEIPPCWSKIFNIYGKANYFNDYMHCCKDFSADDVIMRYFIGESIRIFLSEGITVVEAMKLHVPNDNPEINNGCVLLNTLSPSILVNGGLSSFERRWLLHRTEHPISVLELEKARNFNKEAGELARSKKMAFIKDLVKDLDDKDEEEIKERKLGVKEFFEEDEEEDVLNNNAVNTSENQNTDFNDLEEEDLEKDL